MNEIFEDLANAADELLATYVSNPPTERGETKAGSLNRQLWDAAAAADWFRVILDEVHGGLGLGILEVGHIFRTIGSRLAAGPFLEHAIIVPMLTSENDGYFDRFTDARDGSGVYIWADGASSHTPASHLPSIVDGALTGTVELVRFGMEADNFLVVALIGDVPTVIMVSADAAGVTVSERQTFDSIGSLSDVHFDRVTIFEVVVPDAGETVERIRNVIRLMAAYELAGVARHLLDESVKYAQQRHQFGRPIGSFQAIQHLLADMCTDVLTIEAVCDEAADKVNSPGLIGSVQSMVAKAFASGAARRIGEGALQVHGGIAFTADCSVHKWFLHLLALQGFYGDERELAKEVGRMLLAEDFQLVN